MEDNTTLMGKDHCPVCNYLITAATPTDDSKRVPMPGDCSICINCGAYLQYASDMALIELVPSEWDKLDDKAKIILNKHRSVIKKRGPIPRKDLHTDV